MITVRDLRRRLDHIPDETLVILAKDAEGNDYSPLAGVTSGHYRPITSWSGEPCDPEDPPAHSYRSVFLEPTN